MKFSPVHIFVLFVLATALSVNGMAYPLIQHFSQAPMAATDFSYRSAYQPIQNGIFTHARSPKDICLGGCGSGSYVCLKLCGKIHEGVELIKCAARCQEIFEKCTSLC